LYNKCKEPHASRSLLKEHAAICVRACRHTQNTYHSLLEQDYTFLSHLKVGVNTSINPITHEDSSLSKFWKEENELERKKMVGLRVSG